MIQSAQPKKSVSLQSKALSISAHDPKPCSSASSGISPNFQWTLQVYRSWSSGKIIPREYLRTAMVGPHSRKRYEVTFTKLSKQKQNRKAIESSRQYNAIYNQGIEKGCNIWKSWILRIHKTEPNKEGAGSTRKLQGVSWLWG